MKAMVRRSVIVACVIGFVVGWRSDATAQPIAGVGLQTPNSPLITFRFMFDTGSADDPVGQHGLNALTALMIGRGGTASMTYEEVTSTLYPWAASIGVQYDKEVTTVIGEVHRDHVEPFYQLLRDLVVAPRFEEAAFTGNGD